MVLSKLFQSKSIQLIPWKKISFLLAGCIFLGWLLQTPAGLLGKSDAIGYAVCHRIDLRSFHLDQRQLPLCARCTGQYLGAMFGIVYLTFLGKRRVGRPPWKVIVLLTALAIAYGIDGLNSYLHLLPNMSIFYLYEPNNTLRLLTGTGLGLGISVILLPAYHQTVWTKVNLRPSLDGFLPLTGLITTGLLIDFLVMTENPIVLYPLALISAAGVLVLLTLVYTMVWVMLARKENQFNKFYQLLPFISAGFTTALLQIAALDYLRYLFTGTWDGFHLG
ncbi:MAG: DUF2085 domain-containing protein [Chloroflexi bacterium]|nr:DUF2085 domain-containing protein [Chloroflexota bacterium]